MLTMNIVKVYKQLLIYDNRKGAAVLLTVIIISVSVLIMAFTASLLGLGELDMSYTSQKAGQTLAVADTCIEDSLRRLRLNSSYSGGTLNLDDGSCIISIVTDGSQRTITVVANIDDTYYKKIEAVVTLAGSDTVITSWEEKDD